MSWQRKGTIMVVDDSRLVLSMTRRLLEDAGHTVITQDRPEGCIARIVLEKPDMVLIDVDILDACGNALVHLLGTSQPGNDTILLLYSDMEPSLLKRRVRAAGAHGFVQKSSVPQEVLFEVDGWLRARDAGEAPHYTSMRYDRPSPVLATSGTVRIATPTVLFVDDDMLVLSGYRRDLQYERLVCEFALSGRTAIDRLSSETPPDVLVCDVLMPSLDGQGVLDAARRLSPSWERRMVIVTGASPAHPATDFLGLFRGPVLTKPASKQDLLDAIRSCLSYEGSSAWRSATGG